ncbi:hypothetical protein EDF60_1741 [Leucobacter luti]|uniref:hypothetical protein n=1 Tax=Leucobacter luti TaxID=340320 RepID=UPI001047840B|nr:hypothetical protein [Leucobacter luti]MCW2287091.1 hypothetical protein [Leucobacter luti]TCK41315.1 hypothetical protein EDF60_1741 [Leucobacter luti]
MNSTNRIVNRVLLLVVGLALAAVGALAVLVSAGPERLSTILPGTPEWVHSARTMLADWAAGNADTELGSTAALIAVGAAVIVVIVLVVFIATRGGGRTATVMRATSETGVTTVDRSVADAVIAGTLRERPDVLAASTSSYRVQRQPAIKLTVTMRQGAQLPRVLNAVEDAVREWDALTGAELPVVVHLAGRGWLDRWRSVTRVQ